MDKKHDTSRKFAVVTGASQGIGFELAKVFAENGFDLLICSESDKIFEARTLLEGTHASISAHKIDLAEPNGVDVLMSRIKMQNKSVDAVAINAGVGVGGEFLHTDLKEELNMLNLNVISTVRLAKHIAKMMVAEGRGRILFTSSIAGTMPGPYYAVYAATKAFVQSFSQAIRDELADSGVTVTALMPGATETNFFHRAEMENTKAGQAPKDDPAQVAQQGFDALMAGTDHVVAGSFMNKVQAVMGKIIPETIGAKMQGQQTKPRSH